MLVLSNPHPFWRYACYRCCCNLHLIFAGLINSISTWGGVGLFCLLFRDVFEATEPSKPTDSALVEIVIGRLRLKVCLLALTIFLDCCCCRTASIEPIEFIVAGNCWMFVKEAGLRGSLLGIGVGLDKTSLCARISCLLLIASLLISLIWACSYAFYWFLSSLACYLYLASLAFFN